MVEHGGRNILRLVDDDKHDLSRGFDGSGERRGATAPLVNLAAGTKNMPNKLSRDLYAYTSRRCAQLIIVIPMPFVG